MGWVVGHEMNRVFRLSEIAGGGGGVSPGHKFSSVSRRKVGGRELGWGRAAQRSDTEINECAPVVLTHRPHPPVLVMN